MGLGSAGRGRDGQIRSQEGGACIVSCPPSQTRLANTDYSGLCQRFGRHSSKYTHHRGWGFPQGKGASRLQHFPAGYSTSQAGPTLALGNFNRIGLRINLRALMWLHPRPTQKALKGLLFFSLFSNFFSPLTVFYFDSFLMVPFIIL